MSGEQKIKLRENTKTIMNILYETNNFKKSDDYLEIDNEEKNLVDIQIKALELSISIMIRRCWKNHIWGVKWNQWVTKTR